MDMFKSVFDVFSGTQTYIAIVLVILVALLLGLLIALGYWFINRNSFMNKQVAIAIVVIPASLSIFMALFNLRATELAVSFGASILVSGLFITRFRSAPVEILDLALISLSTFVGLGAGLGYISYAAIGAIVVIGAYVGVSHIKLFKHDNCEKDVRILVPESLDYEHLFDDIFKQYCVRKTLVKTKTIDYGQLFELRYIVKFKNNINEREFIDKIRILNGNMMVIVAARNLNVVQK